MISLKVPPLGESIVEATVSRWLKNEGDAVAAGDTVVELDTDKITVEVPALKAGVLVRRAVQEGAVVKVDDALGEIDETAVATATTGATATAGTTATATTGTTAGETAGATAGATATGGGGAAAAGAPTQANPRVPAEAGTAPTGSALAAGAFAGTPAASATGGAGGGGGGEVKSSPAARREAVAREVDIGAVAGSGRGGVVSKPDVIEAARSAAAPALPAVSAPPAGPAARGAAQAAGSAGGDGQRETRERMTTRRKRIAENLLQSQHATAHLTTFNEIDMTNVITLRERVKERTEKEHGVKLSFMPFFVKAACMALRSFPTVNAQVDGEEIIYKHYVNMGIAVASEQGLVVPNVKNADRKGMLEVARDILALASRARDGKLAMDDLTGGTFTITNGGVFGSLVSTPIINYPQVAILGLHKTQERPVAIAGKVEIRPMMYVALSYDHRIIEGQQAVLFLVRVKELMEDPATMLVD